MNLQWWQNLLQNDKPKFLRIAILAALGLALLVVGSIRPRPTTTARASPEVGASPLVDQENQVARQLVDILQSIPGAGRVKVAVTLSRTIQSQFVTSSSSLSGGTSPLLVNNNAGQTVVPLDQVGPAVQGVVVVARSASNPVLRAELSQAVETLLQVPAYQVLILPT